MLDNLEELYKSFCKRDTPEYNALMALRYEVISLYEITNFLKKSFACLYYYLNGDKDKIISFIKDMTRERKSKKSRGRSSYGRTDTEERYGKYNFVVEKGKICLYILDKKVANEDYAYVTEGRVFIMTESQLSLIKENLELTEHKFKETVRLFISNLLKNPVDAEYPPILKIHNIDKNVLIDLLIKNNILSKTEKIIDTDENGDKIKPVMSIQYNGIKGIWSHILIGLYNHFMNERNIDEATGACCSGGYSMPLFSKIIRR